ncbi:MAG: BON domain-containing protein, partial [Alphaproteobacteria bacterium]|nr:BON domain-containing protein [Alphaproteobacteria bacterium]
MRDDGDHHRDKELEIGCDPAIDAHEISVGVRNRIGILTGLLRSYRERFQAERDARRVASLAAVPNALEVKVA